MQIKVKLDEGAIMPRRAYPTDAGLDLFSRAEVTIQPQGAFCFDTGVHIAIPEGYAGVLMSKSGLNVKHNAVNTGLIDAGYTGSIKVKLYNHSPDMPLKIFKGDKISQLVILPIPPFELAEVDSLEDTPRGANGFGSTGR